MNIEGNEFTKGKRMTFWELIDQTEALIRKKLEDGDLKGAEELRSGLRNLGRGMVAFDDQVRGKVVES